MKGWDYENKQWEKLSSDLKHLPLFTRYFDFTSLIFRSLWAFILKLIFRFYIRMEVKGSFVEIYKNNPKLLIISNHSSHLDAVSIAAAIPFPYWMDLYIAAAKDYWFRNPLFIFFSQHCLGAVPIDRKKNKKESVQLCLDLLSNLKRIWMIIFPEGSRSKDGAIHFFKKGISTFSTHANTPILFLYLEGNEKIMPKGKWPRPGKITVHVGPVKEPASIDEIFQAYCDWVLKINPHARIEKID